MVQGLDQSKRNDIATEFQAGAVYVVGSSSAVGDSNSGAPSTSNSDVVSSSTASGDWSINHDNANGTTTLENVNKIDFGSVSGFTIDQILVASTSDSADVIIDDSPTGDTDLSGDGDLSIEANQLTYTFGSQ